MEEHEAAQARGERGLRVDAATGDAALLAQVDASTALWSR